MRSALSLVFLLLSRWSSSDHHTSQHRFVISRHCSALEFDSPRRNPSSRCVSPSRLLRQQTELTRSLTRTRMLRWSQESISCLTVQQIFLFFFPLSVSFYKIFPKIVVSMCQVFSVRNILLYCDCPYSDMMMMGKIFFFSVTTR